MYFPPACFVARTTASSAAGESVIPGNTGAQITPALIPAAASWRTAPRRRSGRGARGSRILASSVFSVVIVRLTKSELCSAIRRSNSTSRKMRSDFVTIPISSPMVQREFFQDPARHLEALLSRLIGIGGRANGDLLAALHFLQVLPQQPRRLLLHVDLALKVHAVAQLHKLVSVARVAILARELAAAIGIDCPLERHPPGSATIEQRARGQREIFHQMPLADGFALRRQLGNSHQLWGLAILDLEQRRIHGVAKYFRFLFAF